MFVKFFFDEWIVLHGNGVPHKIFLQRLKRITKRKALLRSNICIHSAMVLSSSVSILHERMDRIDRLEEKGSKKKNN